MVLSMRNLARPVYGHWVSLPWVVRTFTAEENAAGTTEPPETVKARVDATTWVGVLNLNSEPVDVVINFFDFHGNYMPDISTVLHGVPSKAMGDYTAAAIPLRKSGWVSVSCKKPIYPSGTIFEMIEHSVGVEGVSGVATQVETPLTFFPIYDADLVIDP